MLKNDHCGKSLPSGGKRFPSVSKLDQKVKGYEPEGIEETEIEEEQDDDINIVVESSSFREDNLKDNDDFNETVTYRQAKECLKLMI